MSTVVENMKYRYETQSEINWLSKIRNLLQQLLIAVMSMYCLSIICLIVCLFVYLFLMYFVHEIAEEAHGSSQRIKLILKTYSNMKNFGRG